MFGRRGGPGTGDRQRRLVHVDGIHLGGRPRDEARPVPGPARGLEDSPAREHARDLPLESAEISLPGRQVIDAIVFASALGVGDRLVHWAPTSFPISYRRRAFVGQTLPSVSTTS